MFQLDDTFLEELGLGELPDAQKKAFLQHTYEQLEQRVGVQLSEGMTDAQLQEFEYIIDRNEEKVRQWLAAHVPDYANDPLFQKLKQTLKLDPQSSAGDASPIALEAEFAASRWLELNRPDYRDVVKATLDAIKAEIVANRDVILGRNPS